MHTKPRRKRKVRTGGTSIRKRRIGACLAAVILAALAVAFQASAFQQNLVRSWVEELEQRSGLHIEISKYSWGLPLQLVMGRTEVTLAGKTIARCERVTATFGLSLERPFWRVASLALDRPVFYLEKDSRGHWTTARESTEVSGRGGRRLKTTASSQASSGSIRIRVESGTVVAEQDGLQVLKVQNVTGEITIPHDGALGVSALLAHLEKLRPAAPRALSLRPSDGGSP